MAFDSLFIGVTGLDAYQSQIDVISNNIANVGTVGFKGQNVSFQDLFYQTQGYASAPSQTLGGVNAQQVGDGVKIGSVDTDWSQGGIQTTGVNTNMAINGNGFFVLRNIDNSGPPSYTRDGDFSLNENGYMYDPGSGLAVLGYPVAANGTISQIAPPVPLQIPLGIKSEAVGTGFGAKIGPTGDSVFDVSLGGNLDQTQYISAVSTGTVTAYTITTTMYDSLGNSHAMQIQYNPAVGANGASLLGGAFAVTNASGVAVTAASEWQYTVTAQDGSADGTPPSPVLGTGYLFFDANGQFINSSSLSGNAGAIPLADLHTEGQAASAAAGNLISVTQWGVPAGANNAVSVGTGTANPAIIGLDFSGNTSLAGTADPNTIAQNGYPLGTLSNITIGQDGLITGAYTNGQSTSLGKIALAGFSNESGLTRVGQNQFQASPNSGTAQYNFPGIGQLGTIDSGSLEQSNVSIADQFTKMILAQRSFEANGKSITTADQDLQTVIGLKQ
jgi:flagellar hook protein FlgE